MATKNEICTMALGHLGVDIEISNLDTDQGIEARSCRIFYDQSLEQTLRDFNWPFATKIADLALVEEDPNDEWSYSYRYPSDCIMARRIQSGSRNDTRQSRVPFRIISDTSGRLILTDAQDAVMEYTKETMSEGLYEADFSMAMSLRLASYIAPKVAGSSWASLREAVLKLYSYELMKAQANHYNEEQHEEDPQSEFQRARNS